ncbi:hypothetical protein G9A89_000286, partial [Geosiphon pyriformis]
VRHMREPKRTRCLHKAPPHTPIFDEVRPRTPQPGTGTRVPGTLRVPHVRNRDSES